MEHRAKPRGLFTYSNSSCNGGVSAQHAQPAEGIHLFVFAARPGRHAGAADAVEAVTAGNKLAIDAVLAAVMAIGHEGMRAVEISDRDILCFVHRGETCRGTRFHEITRQFGLAIHQHGSTARERVQIDPVLRTVHQQADAFMHQTLPMHARTHAGLIEEVYGHLFENAGADAAQHVVRRLALEYHRGDSRAVQELAEQQAGGTGTDDRRPECAYRRYARRRATCTLPKLRA